MAMVLKRQLSIYLKNSGMSASELARRAGVPRKTLQNWSTGQKPKDFDQVKRVASVIGCSLDELIYGESSYKSAAATIFPDSDSWFGGIFEIKIRRVRK